MTTDRVARAVEKLGDRALREAFAYTAAAYKSVRSDKLLTNAEPEFDDLAAKLKSG